MKTELGAVESVRLTRSGLVIIVCVSVGQREKALWVKLMGARDVNFVTLNKRVP